MPNNNDIHIIASGENIHNTVPHAINEFKMSKAIIVVEKSVYEKPEYKRNPKIIEAIKKVEDMTKITKKGFEIKYIDTISLNNIRDVVMEIINENPQDSTYYFNITGGTKVLSNGLFMMAMWLDGVVYHVGEDEVLQRLVVPRLHMEDVKKNPNYLNILEILDKSNGKKLKRKYLFEELKDVYKPIREMDKKIKRELSPGTLSKWTSDLIRWGLIVEKPFDNKKEKLYQITDDGVFTLRFFKSKIRSAS